MGIKYYNHFQGQKSVSTMLLVFMYVCMYVCMYVWTPDFFQVYFHVGDFEHELDVLVGVPDPVEQRLHRTGDDALTHFAVNVAFHCVCLKCSAMYECMYIGV